MKPNAKDTHKLIHRPEGSSSSLSFFCAFHQNNMETQFGSLLSKPQDNHDDNGDRFRPQQQNQMTSDRRSGFVSTDKLVDDKMGDSQRDGRGDSVPSRTFGRFSGVDVNGPGMMSPLMMTMTPTTQFLEQPEIFNVQKGGPTGGGGGPGSRSGGVGGGADSTAPLDDLLVDLQYKSPHMVYTCGGGLAGFALGAMLHKYANMSVTVQWWLGLPGYLYTFAIQCITIPLIFTSVTICFANLLMSRKTKGVVVRMIIYFVLASFLACCIALGVSFMFTGTFSKKPDLPSTVQSASLNLMCPNGKYLSKQSSVCEGNQLHDAMTFVATNITGISLDSTGVPTKTYSFAAQIVSFFDDLFTQNITEAFKDGEFMSVTAFSVLFALGLVLTHDPATGEQNYAFVLLKQVDVVLEMILNWLIPWTPIGTFSAMTYYSSSGTITQNALTEVMYFTITMVVTLLAYFVLVTCVGYFLLVRKNPFQFFWFLMPAIVFMFGSSDYMSTIPVLMRSIEGSKQVSRTLSQFSVCAGISFALCGTAAYFVVAVIFMAYTSGLEDSLTLGRLIGLVVLGTLSSIGTPHQAGITLTYTATIWRALFGTLVPASFEYLQMIEWLVIRMRRTFNIIMIAFIARVIAEQLDETVEDEDDRVYAEHQIGLAHM
ncbi:Dicarboxylate/amino acid:cation symporter, partial [Globisporangium splendens]